MPYAVAADQNVPVGESGLRVFRAEIGKDEAACLVNGIALDHLAANPVRLLGFEGPLDALAGTIVQPAVIGAAKRLALDEPVEQRRSAVRAPLLHEQRRAGTWSRQDKILAQQPDFQRLVDFKFRRECHRMPVTPQKFAAGCSGPDFGKQIVCFLVQHEILLACRIAPLLECPP